MAQPVGVASPKAYVKCVSLSATPLAYKLAVSTREYQLDQSSPLPASPAADPVLVGKKRPAHLDRSYISTSGSATIGPELAILAGIWSGMSASAC
jgi:hypothetical protein